MKIVRWKYVLPRLLIVLVIASGLRRGLDPVLKTMLVASGEAAVGAKVDLGAIETSLTGGTLEIRKLTVANPNAAMKNLFEAEQASLNIDISALCRGRLVVEDGLLSSVQLGNERTTSGLLEPVANEAAAGPSFFDPVSDYAAAFAADWLEQLDERLRSDFTDQLQTPRVAKQLEQRWPQQYEQLQDQVKSLRQHSHKLKQRFQELRKNPLGHLTQLKELQEELVAAKKELMTLQQQIAQLPHQAEADRLAILAARREDELFVRQQLQITDLDEAGLTQTLLGQPTAQGLATALDWLGWARKKIPSGKVSKHVERSRGTHVLFAPAQPTFLVKQLRLEGKSQWSGHTVAMEGMLKNVCSEPQRHNKPVQIELKGSGAAEFEVLATLDRRREVPQDHLQIVCHEVALPGQTMGNTEKLSLVISPSQANLNIDLMLRGDELTGKISLGQHALKLTPQQASRRSPELVAALEQALDKIEQWEATVQIAGTLQQPKFEIESDLGHQVAGSLHAAVQQLLRRRADALLAQTQQKVAARLQKLEQLRSAAQQELMAKLGEGQGIFSHLAALPASEGPTVSIPRLSKSLQLPTQRK